MPNSGSPDRWPPTSGAPGRSRLRRTDSLPPASGAGSGTWGRWPRRSAGPAATTRTARSLPGCGRTGTGRPHRYGIYLSFIHAASRQLAAGDSWPSGAGADLFECALFNATGGTDRLTAPRTATHRLGPGVTVRVPDPWATAGAGRRGAWSISARRQVCGGASRSPPGSSSADLRGPARRRPARLWKPARRAGEGLSRRPVKSSLKNLEGFGTRSWPVAR